MECTCESVRGKPSQSLCGFCQEFAEHPSGSGVAAPGGGLMKLPECPACGELPTRSCNPRSPLVRDPDATTYFLQCECDDGDERVDGDTPEACERAWIARVDNVTANRAEAAYERQCSDFYGGSGPVTLKEQCEAAVKQKREIG